MKLFLICIELLPFFCNCSTETKEGNREETNSVSETPSEPKVLLKNFNEEDIAKFAISSVMSQPTKIISVKKDGDLYIVSYTRRNDGQRFVYKVKIEGYRAIWATIDGRWRDSPEDEQIVFVETGKKLKIIQRFSDDSTIEKEFSK